MVAMCRTMAVLTTPYSPVSKLVARKAASIITCSAATNRTILESKIQRAINDCNVLRGGFLLTVESADVYTNNQVFPVNASGVQTSDVPFTIVDNQRKIGAYYGFYLQDEWKVFGPLTINLGGRFDVVDEYAHANQLSPRVNVVFQATKSTTLHAGYARYFTPPALELVGSQTINEFIGTSNQSAVLQNTAVKPERANYFDAGMTEQFTRAFSMGVDSYSRPLIT